MGSARTRTAVIAVAAALSVAALPVASVADAPTGAITGHVVNERGSPVGWCTVEADDEEANAVFGARSTPDGSYRIDDLPPGAYIVSAECGPGYRAVYADDPDWGPKPVEVGAGAVVPVDLEPENRNGWVEGAVTDEQGDPVEGLCVAAYDATIQGHEIPGEMAVGEARPGPEEWTITTTGAGGTYHLGGFWDARFKVLFEECSLEPTTWRPEWFGGGRMWPAATIIQTEADNTFTAIADASVERLCVGPDSDGDGLSDCEEVALGLSDPSLADTDDDRLSDREELHRRFTAPAVPDTDGDSYTDGLEVLGGYCGVVPIKGGSDPTHFWARPRPDSSRTPGVDPDGRVCG